MPPVIPPDAQREIDLSAEIKGLGLYRDILKAALFLYPWGQEGTVLATAKGPNREQARFFDDLSDEIQVRNFDGINPVMPIKMSVSSGHGTGKTELIGMLAGILMVTRPAMRGTVTANTGNQLATKTWPAIRKYHKLLICSHWFDITSELYWRIGRREDWCIQTATCKEENSDAFQGQHARTSSSVYFFDEDSNVPDTIHTAAEGGQVWGEPMEFRWGNPTRRTGGFYDVNFGTKRNYWLRYTLGKTKDTDYPAGLRRWDARYTEFKNERLNQEWIEEYGEDSDFCRVRIYGLPPNASDLAFIPADLVSAAQKRPPSSLPDDPLICGVDLSWGGDDPICIRFRCGMDARSIPPVKIRGAETRDNALIIAKLADILSRTYNGRKVAMMFIDSAGTCGIIVTRLRELGHTNIREINFMGFSPDPKFSFMRSYMWGQVKENLQQLAIDLSPDLEADLQAPGFKLTKNTEILLEKKQDVIKRLGHSTDDADALALTYAAKVASQQKQRMAQQRRIQQSSNVGVWT